MKHNEIDSLMRKYTAGTLTDDELQELERLTHKAETMATASRRATAIVRRRAALAVAAVMVGGASLLTVLPQHDEAPLVAQAEELIIKNEELIIKNDEGGKLKIKNEELRIEDRASNLSPLTSHLSPSQDSHLSPHEDPVVVCNNECDADSVINDIRKFLSV